MVDSLMYKEDNYVVLETGQSEQFLTAPELLEKLQVVLQEIEIGDIPRDLQKLGSIQEQAKSLLDTSCELDVGRGKYLQWYAVRLEK